MLYLLLFPCSPSFLSPSLSRSLSLSCVPCVCPLLSVLFHFFTVHQKSFADLDVRAGYMEGAMEASTSMATPPDEVDNLISMVADEAGLDAALVLDKAGDVGTSVPTKAAEAGAVKPEDGLEARLAALRR